MPSPSKFNVTQTTCERNDGFERVLYCITFMCGGRTSGSLRSPILMRATTAAATVAMETMMRTGRIAAASSFKMLYVIGTCEAQDGWRIISLLYVYGRVKLAGFQASRLSLLLSLLPSLLPALLLLLPMWTFVASGRGGRAKPIISRYGCMLCG
jgi:hypothetical protein